MGTAPPHETRARETEPQARRGVGELTRRGGWILVLLGALMILIALALLLVL